MRRIYFQHIPKTAGTSVAYYLDRYFDLNEIVGPIAQHDYLKLEPSYLRSIRFVTGHLARLPHLFDPYPFTTVTVMRDPIDRALSLLQHLAEDPTMNQQTGIGRRAIEELIEDPMIIDRLVGMSYLLEFGTDRSCPVTVEGGDLGPLPDAFDPATDKEARARALVRAKSSLDQCFVMQVETLDADLRQLGRNLDPNSMAEPVRRANSRSNKKELPYQLIEVIENHLPEDIELFNHSKSRTAITPPAEGRTIVELANFGFEKPISGFGWSGRSVSALEWSKTGRYLDSAGAGLLVKTDGIKEITISALFFGLHQSSNENLQFFVNGQQIRMRLVYPYYPDCHPGRFVGSFRILSPKPFLEILIRPDPQFVDSLDLREYYFNDFGMHSLNYAFFLSVFGCVSD